MKTPARLFFAFAMSIALSTAAPAAAPAPHAAPSPANAGFVAGAPSPAAAPAADPAPAAPSEPEWRVYDGTELPLEGRGWPAERLATPYQRLPADSHESLPPDVRGLQGDSAGLCFRFVTDSAKLRIFWKCTKPVCRMWNLAASGADGVDVYQLREDGWQFVRPPFPVTPKNEGAEYTWDVVPHLPTMLYLPTYNGIEQFRLSVEPGCSVRPAPPRASGIVKPVVFYGTSITQGASASHPDRKSVV